MTRHPMGLAWTILAILAPAGIADANPGGLRGDPAAIADARAMVEAMGGAAIWAELGRIHLVHEWRPWNRPDTYVENEILDFTGPRSRADRTSEIHRQVRVYSPEGKRWTLTDGVFAYGDEEQLRGDLARAPFNFYRLVHAVAADDPFYEVRFGDSDVPGAKRIEFRGPDGALGGWVVLNARKEPIVKATPEYRYTLGPLKRFGNLRIPAWGVYDTGTTMYEMISLDAGREAPDPEMFAPPAAHRSQDRP